METLSFTPRHIAEIENEKRLSIQEIVSDLSMNNMALFVKKAMKFRDNYQALDMIEDWMKNGETFETIWAEINISLYDSGFLPKDLPIEEVKAKLQEYKDKYQGHSESTGKNKKDQL